MSNKQVIAIFIVGLALLLAAFWAGLSVIKDEAMPMKPAAASQTPPIEPQPRPAEAAQQQEQPESEEAKYVIEVAAFGTLTQAKQLESDLKAKKNFSAHVSEQKSDGLYHVTIGPHGKLEAERKANELSSEGRKGIMILPWKGK